MNTTNQHPQTQRNNQSRKVHSLIHSQTQPLQRQPKQDYRCEYELPKYCDLNNIDDDYRFSSITTQRITSTELNSIMIKSIEKKSKSPITDSKHSTSIDQYFDWFQEYHDFKIHKPPQPFDKNNLRNGKKAFLKQNTSQLPPAFTGLNGQLQNVQKPIIQNHVQQQAKKRRFDEISQPQSKIIQNSNNQSQFQQQQQLPDSPNEDEAIRNMNQPKRLKTDQNQDQAMIQIQVNQQVLQQEQQNLVQNPLKFAPAVQKANNQINNLKQNNNSNHQKINFIEKNKNKVRDMSGNFTQKIKSKVFNVTYHQQNNKSNERLNLAEPSYPQVNQDQVKIHDNHNKNENPKGFSKIRPKTCNKENNQLTNNLMNHAYKIPGLLTKNNLSSTQHLNENFNHLNITNQNQNFQANKPQQHAITQNKFFYQPPLFSQRYIRLWEQKTGKDWYQLSPDSRNKSNNEIQQIYEEYLLKQKQSQSFTYSAYSAFTSFNRTTGGSGFGGGFQFQKNPLKNSSSTAAIL